MTGFALHEPRKHATMVEGRVARHTGPHTSQPAKTRRSNLSRQNGARPQIPGDMNQKGQKTYHAHHGPAMSTTRHKSRPNSDKRLKIHPRRSNLTSMQMRFCRIRRNPHTHLIRVQSRQKIQTRQAYQWLLGKVGKGRDCEQLSIFLHFRYTNCDISDKLR